MVLIQTADFSVQDLVDQLRRQCAGQAGAVVSFTGYVRDYTPEHPTDILFLEHYPGMCEREIESLCQQAMQRWDILNTLVVHRVGELHNSEQIVFVGVASAHRGEAFRACEFIIDTLKTRAPFWKREHLAGGESFWVEQHSADEEKTRSWNTNDTTH